MMKESLLILGTANHELFIRVDNKIQYILEPNDLEQDFNVLYVDNLNIIIVVS